MENLPTYYTTLFNAVTDALEALDHQNVGQARELLLRGQQTAEEQYIEAEKQAGGFLPGKSRGRGSFFSSAVFFCPRRSEIVRNGQKLSETVKNGHIILFNPLRPPGCQRGNPGHFLPAL